MAQNSVSRTHTEGSMMQQMFGWVVPTQAVQHPVHMVVNVEQYVPSQASSARDVYNSSYDTYYRPGQPETAAVRPTNYEQPDSMIPESVRARPWLKSANGIGGRAVNTVAQEHVGGFGTRGNTYYQRAYGAHEVPTDFIPTSTFDRRHIEPADRNVLRKLAADQVMMGNRYLKSLAAQPSQFDLEVFNATQPPGAQYVDSTSMRSTNDHGLDAPAVLGEHRTSGPNPGYIPMGANNIRAPYTDGVSQRGLRAVGQEDDGMPDTSSFCTLV